MPRTTFDIEAPILAEIRALGKRDKRGMGRVVSELLADALARRKQEPRNPTRLGWVSRPMGLRVDIDDRDALYGALDATQE